MENDNKVLEMPAPPAPPKTLKERLEEDMTKLVQQIAQVKSQAIQFQGQLEGLQHVYGLLMAEQETKP